MKPKLVYTFLFFIGISFRLLNAQDYGDQLNVINDYIEFTNESMHGMLIAHRLFENYNQDLNRYVDLPGHQLNYYNNNDLPLDIFEDPENWFYARSPEQLFNKTQASKEVLPAETFQELQQTISEIRKTTQKANSLRLTIADSINILDLNNRIALGAVYDQLEAAVETFDLLQAQSIILQSQIKRFYSANSQGLIRYPELMSLLSGIHETSLSALYELKKENRTALLDLIGELRGLNDKMRSYSLKKEGGFPSPSYIHARKSIIKNVDDIISNIRLFLDDAEIPEEYRLYGNTYYYYNTQVINKINRYGNGLVPSINQIIDQLNIPVPYMLETPHYLTIIYPQKIEKQLPVISSSRIQVDETPMTLENRAIVMSDEKHQILVDNSEPVLEIFDHLKQDGDIISLNFNGDWIFENLSLERTPRKFILKLNEKGKNYLILHAINEGSVPPNTIGINYVHDGRRKRYILQSNLRTSQMVEIKLDE